MTEDHPFWNETAGEFEHTESLEPGDLLLGLEGETFIVQRFEASVEKWGTAYSLSVSGPNTYIVANDAGESAVVHNCHRINPSGEPDAIRSSSNRPDLELIPMPSGPRLTTATNSIQNLTNAGELSAVGGVYRIVENTPAGPVVIRTGRTNDLTTRFAAHRTPSGGYGDTNVYDIEIIVRTDDYNEQRGIEQLAYDAYESTASAANGGDNSVRAIGLSNRFREFFHETGVAAIELL